MIFLIYNILIYPQSALASTSGANLSYLASGKQRLNETEDLRSTLYLGWVRIATLDLAFSIL